MTSRPPSGLGPRSRKFWRDVLASWELSRDELEILLEACRAIDQADALREAIDSDGVVVTGAAGQPRVHPAVTQLNATRSLLARLLAQLALPDLDGGRMPTARTVRAQRAARSRWETHSKRGAS